MAGNLPGSGTTVQSLGGAVMSSAESMRAHLLSQLFFSYWSGGELTGRFRL